MLWKELVNKWGYAFEVALSSMIKPVSLQLLLQRVWGVPQYNSQVTNWG
jgi:uncharacterized membrane protein YhhN